MSAHLTTGQWREVARLWSRVGRLSLQRIDGVLSHAARVLQSLVQGSHAMMVVQRTALSDIAPGAFRVVEVCDFGPERARRREVRRRWMRLEPALSRDPMLIEIASTAGRHRTLGFRAVGASSGTGGTATGRLLDELGVVDRVVSVFPLSGEASGQASGELEVAFCVDRPVSAEPFDASDRAIIHTVTEGLRPLARNYAGRNGLLAGQERLDAHERALVTMMLEGTAPAEICAALEISADVFGGQRDGALKKLGVTDEFGLLQLCTTGASAGAPGATVSTGQPRPTAVPTAESLLERARDAVRERLVAGDLSIGSAARQLGVSERTLQRKLSGVQTNFSKLADETRRDRAYQLLVETSLDYIDIAMHLGYDHVSSFNRAVKRWFGTTPSELRRGSSQGGVG